MDDLTVFPADLNDPAHAAAVVELLDSYAMDPMGGATPLTDDVKVAMIPGMLKLEATRVWLALEGDRFIGVVTAFVGFATFHGKPRMNIHDIAVLPDARGKGVGRLMLGFVIAAAQQEGCAAVALEVRHDNAPARHLYESMGFGAHFAPMDFWDRPLD
jgi:ribosomal protein S18 acetylase RimI-like enzyme